MAGPSTCGPLAVLESWFGKKTGLLVLTFSPFAEGKCIAAVGSYPRLGFMSSKCASNSYPCHVNKMAKHRSSEGQRSIQIAKSGCPETGPHLSSENHIYGRFPQRSTTCIHIRFFSSVRSFCRTLNYVVMFSARDLLNGYTIGIGAVLVLLYVVGGAIYRLYLSPLAQFPGPKLAALTLWYSLLFPVFLSS